MVYVKIVLDSRRKASNKIHPVKVRVTFDREQKYYQTGISLSKEDFLLLEKSVPPKSLRDAKIQIEHLELKVKTIISKMEYFTFYSFEQIYFQSRKAVKSLYDLYQQMIDEMMTEERIGSALSYRCSMRSLKRFRAKLAFIDVTPELLKKYEKHLLDDGKSISTVGIYIRPLRAVINYAIHLKLLPADAYPFGLRKYVIPESRNIKKALSKADFKAIVDYQPQECKSLEDRSKDFWLLSYLCQGINIKDLLLLKKQDIDGKFIKFIRQKTKRSSRGNLKEISAPIIPEMGKIISKWKCIDENSEYLFPFVSSSMTAYEIYQTTHQFVKTINKYMDRISKTIGVEKKVRCYTARFQFTKTMIDAGLSLHFLKECLGHNNIITTQRYVDSFQDDLKYDIANNHLLKF